MYAERTPRALLNIFARAYARNPTATENDLLWLIRELRRQPHHFTNFWFYSDTFNEILGMLKAGHTAVEDNDAGDAG